MNRWAIADRPYRDWGNGTPLHSEAEHQLDFDPLNAFCCAKVSFRLARGERHLCVAARMAIAGLC
jgi:hypothetical protein